MTLRAKIALIAALLALVPSVASTETWPYPAERSGPFLPKARELRAALLVQGAYIPSSSSTGDARAATLGGVLGWCFAPFERLGLFGLHELEGYWWANVTLMAHGNVLGLRYVAARHLTFEGAFLSHRVPRVWIDDLETRPGGVADNGGELGVWLPFSPHPRIRIELHLISRAFEVYKDTQGVLGGGLRLSLLIGRRTSLELELTLLRTTRSRPRAGVEDTTSNVIGEACLRTELARSLGMLLGAKLTTSMLVGEQPMLELKRSMIDEPMGLAYAGVTFGI